MRELSYTHAMKDHMDFWESQFSGRAIFMHVWRTILRGRVCASQIFAWMHRDGVSSFGILMATALCTGVMMVLQAEVYVRRFAAYHLLGWFSGYSTLREIGPVLMALMFSGRVGSAYTADLASMRVRSHLETLWILGVDVYAWYIVPRVLSMIFTLVCLVIVGDVVAIGGSALCALLLLGVHPILFLNTLFHAVSVSDFAQGLLKSVFLGVGLSCIATYVGLQAREGAASVGDAVRRYVVASAFMIFGVDFLITYVVDILWA